MADTAGDKAEKLAAAKKRFDEIKKKQAKGKKKADKAEKAHEVEDTDKGEGSERPEQKKKKGKKDKTGFPESNTDTQSAAEPRVNEKAVEAEVNDTSAAPDVSTSVLTGEDVTIQSPAAPLPPSVAETANESAAPIISPHVQSPAAASHSRAASFSANRNSLNGTLRRPSISAADILRSTNARSPNALSPTEVVPDIYRKQATTISELTETVERLDKEAKVLKEKESKLNNVLLENEELVEQVASLRTSLAVYKSRFEAGEKVREGSESEIEKLKSELESSTRQISHLTSQISQKSKMISDLRSQNTLPLSEFDQEAVKEKENQIESMEMEISKLRIDLERSSNSLSEAYSSLAVAEEKAKALDETQVALQATINKLKRELDKASDQNVAESAARISAESLAKSLQAAVDAHNATIKKLESSITSWEKDHKTLKELYTEADNTAQESQKKASALEKENEYLSRQISALTAKCNRIAIDNAKLKDLVDNHQFESRRGTGSMQNDDDELDVLEADERRKMRNKIEELQRLLQEGRHRVAAAVDKNPLSLSRSGGSHRRGLSNSTAQGDFLEVEFLGNYPPVGEDDFLPSDDEEVYQQSRANYSQRRNEHELRLEKEKRAAEIKAGLMKWKGHKLDLTQIGGSFLGFGEMFEI